MSNLRKAAERLHHLHLCEQEGMSSGAPKPEDWYKAVDDLGKALAAAKEEQAPIIDVEGLLTEVIKAFVSFETNFRDPDGDWFDGYEPGVKYEVEQTIRKALDPFAGLPADPMKRVEALLNEAHELLASPDYHEPEDTINKLVLQALELIDQHQQQL